MNGTRCAISPEMNATSGDSRSSLETITGHFPQRMQALARFGGAFLFDASRHVDHSSSDRRFGQDAGEH
jgi:hypothetical protein